MLGVPQDTQAYVKNLTACIQKDASGDPVILTAGATEDGVKVTGQTIDRNRLTSCALAVNAIAKLAADKTLSFAVEYQDSADGSTWNTAVALQASTALLTDSGSGSTLVGTLELYLDFTNLDRYVRFNITPDLSAASVDTAIWSANVTMSGAKRSSDV